MIKYSKYEKRLVDLLFNNFDQVVTLDDILLHVFDIENPTTKERVRANTFVSRTSLKCALIDGCVIVNTAGKGRGRRGNFIIISHAEWKAVKAIEEEKERTISNTTVPAKKILPDFIILNSFATGEPDTSPQTPAQSGGESK